MDILETLIREVPCPYCGEKMESPSTALGRVCHPCGKKFIVSMSPQPPTETNLAYELKLTLTEVDSWFG